MTSAEKTARLLTLLGQEPYEFGVTELGNMIDCSKSGTFKLLAALMHENLVAQTAEHKYTLGIGVYQLGQCYKENDGLVCFAQPYVKKLRDLTEENASFSILNNNKPMRIWKASSKQVVRIVGEVGEARAFYVGSISKLLAAYMNPKELAKIMDSEQMVAYTQNTITDKHLFLEELAVIRRQGYAFSDGEYREETCGIAAPVRDAAGKVWGALSIGVPKIRMTEDTKEKYIQIVCSIADEMSISLIRD